MATLPTLSKTMDNKFVQTFFEVKAEAEDNILKATPVWAALKMNGCFKTQEGGTNIEETIRYAVGPTAVAVQKGSTLPSGEVETRTAAFWTFRNVAAHAQRSIFDDIENRGKFRIVDYVEERLGEAFDALGQKFETDLWRAHVTDESGSEIQGLNDLVPPVATRATGTYGGVARAATFSTDSSGMSRGATGNTFWAANYFQLVAPYEVNLVANLNTMYNGTTLNKEAPNLIVSDQGLFEIYQNQALNMSQIIKDEATKLADLGFPVIRFNGKPWVWSVDITANNILLLNTNKIICKYDPGMWFDRTEWKWAAADSDVRLMHILCRMNMYTKQPRRFTRGQTSAV